MAEIEDALNHVDPDHRELWLVCGMALHSELGEGGRGLWDNWSVHSAKYDARDQERTWSSFKADGGIRIGTLLKIARDSGWQGWSTGRSSHIAVTSMELGAGLVAESW